MGAVSEKLVAKSVMSLELSLDFSLPESSVYSTLRRKDDSVLATGLLRACSVAMETISPRPGKALPLGGNATSVSWCNLSVLKSPSLVRTQASHLLVCPLS